MHPQRGIDGRSILPGKEAGLQLSGQVPALGQRQYRFTGQMPLESNFIKLPVVKEAEFRRQATEGPDKPKLCGDEVNDVTEPGLLGKLEATLGFPLHLNQRISSRQKVRVQVVAAVSRKSEVAGLVRGLESATQQITASPEMFRPWHDSYPKHT